ncbi:hypothetical protein MPL3365_230060 [Mesorhizobium plurifarium]|uniref:Uncharacterized protein n=1 Tax=Mesorhizobium plurifarium TaxID=69974 RepID=A0A090GAS9_MESPL|nr:hypothetical protein MPL3365_230060 [Mesorhizobium plurifarium]
MQAGSRPSYADDLKPVPATNSIINQLPSRSKLGRFLRLEEHAIIVGDDQPASNSQSFNLRPHLPRKAGGAQGNFRRNR